MLENLFNPKSIAVVGVSQDASKLGSVIYSNIIDAGFEGALYPVNPKYDDIGGVKAYKSVSDIGKEVDLVVVVVPAAFVKDVVADCATSQVNNLVIISAGFGETGAEGKEIEDEILKIASQANMRILGPNCLGISVPGAKFDASFAARMPNPGQIAFMSQSGAFNTALLDLAAESQLGFSHFVSVGNKSDLNELDFLEAWGDDRNVKVIAMYLEEFTDGKDFVNLIAKTNKPVVILNPGNSTQAQAAISSHTGSLASPRAAVDAALRKAGAVRVDSAEKMFNVLRLFSESINPTGSKVAIVTNAGGPGVMVTDMVDELGLQVPEFSDAVQQVLKKYLPAEASTHNPVDLIGDALADRYENTINVLLQTDEVDSIVVILTPQRVTQIAETAKVIAAAAKSGKKLVIPIFMGGKDVREGLDIFQNANVPAFQFAEEAIYALGKLVGSTTEIEIVKLEHKLAGSINLSDYALKTEMALPQATIIQLCAEAGISMPKQLMSQNVEDALHFANEVSYPVVLKADTEDIVHKTDVRALYLRIANADVLRNAYGELTNTVMQETGKQEHEIKLLVQKQLAEGLELIVGVKRDGDMHVYESTGKGFGHLLVVGSGGIYTEVYEDVSNGLVPLSRSQLHDMVLNTKVSQIIAGARGQDQLALEKLLDLLEAVQKLVIAYPQIDAIDINPVMLSRDDCVAVDVKILVKA